MRTSWTTSWLESWNTPRDVAACFYKTACMLAWTSVSCRRQLLLLFHPPRSQPYSARPLRRAQMPRPGNPSRGGFGVKAVPNAHKAQQQPKKKKAERPRLIFETLHTEEYIKEAHPLPPGVIIPPGNSKHIMANSSFSVKTEVKEGYSLDGVNIFRFVARYLSRSPLISFFQCNGVHAHHGRKYRCLW